MITDAANSLDRADRGVRSAEVTLADGDANGACGLAYYAMFYAARAALIVAGEHRAAMAKTHSGLIAAFNQHFVQTDLIAAEHGRSLASEASRRLLASYQGELIRDEAAAEAINHAIGFIAAVRGWIARRSGGDA